MAEGQAPAAVARQEKEVNRLDKKSPFIDNDQYGVGLLPSFLGHLERSSAIPEGVGTTRRRVRHLCKRAWPFSLFPSAWCRPQSAYSPSVYGQWVGLTSHSSLGLMNQNVLG